MNYNFFLFYSLLKDLPNSCPFIHLPYDEGLAKIEILHEEFLTFDKKNHEVGEYESICMFIKEKYPVPTLSELVEQLKHFYEVDLDNCTMSHENWIKTLAKALYSGQDELKLWLTVYLAEREEEKINFKVLDKKDVDENTEMIYLESPNGFHFAVDATFIDQVDDFEMKLPTGEVFKTSEINL